MPEAGMQQIKENVEEIKTTVKDVQEKVNDLRVLLAENYVTRKEVEKLKEDAQNALEGHKKEDQSSRRWWATFIIAATGLLMTLINVLNH